MQLDVYFMDKKKGERQEGGLIFYIHNMYRTAAAGWLLMFKLPSIDTQYLPCVSTEIEYVKGPRGENFLWMRSRLAEFVDDI
jgi:hypothetical protein